MLDCMGRVCSALQETSEVAIPFCVFTNIENLLLGNHLVGQFYGFSHYNRSNDISLSF